ncbi:unnamed protein product [Boreogadus saida]
MNCSDVPRNKIRQLMKIKPEFLHVLIIVHLFRDLAISEHQKVLQRRSRDMALVTAGRRSRDMALVTAGRRSRDMALVTAGRREEEPGHGFSHGREEGGGAGTWL